jgi:hypothetical protein
MIADVFALHGLQQVPIVRSLRWLQHLEVASVFGFRASVNQVVGILRFFLRATTFIDQQNDDHFPLRLTSEHLLEGFIMAADLGPYVLRFCLLLPGNGSSASVL